MAGTRIDVSTVVPAPPTQVWEDVRHIASHVEWMEDAAAIRFTTDSTYGVGTAFDCETRIGPLRLTDRMEVTDWVEGRRMGIRHVGLVTGSGHFTLEESGPGHTRFTWSETLVFPWWMGGAIGGLVAAPLLRWVWRRNLRNLAQRF